MQVVQTSVLLKYKPLFAFLQNYAPNVAQEVQRAYSGAARTYYETGFRRYIRSLGWIKVCRSSSLSQCKLNALSQARSPEKPDSIIAAPTPGEISVVDLERLAHARLDGPSVTLAYMGDDKTHVRPPPPTSHLNTIDSDTSLERANRSPPPLHPPGTYGQRDCGIHLCHRLLCGLRAARTPVAAGVPDVTAPVAGRV